MAGGEDVFECLNICRSDVSGGGSTQERGETGRDTWDQGRKTGRKDRKETGGIKCHLHLQLKHIHLVSPVDVHAVSAEQ